MKVQVSRRLSGLSSIGHGRNWAALIRRQLSGGHDDALDVRAHLGENALHVAFFAHGFLSRAGRAGSGFVDALQ